MEKYLTMVREANGMLVPHVDGCPIAGHVDVSISTNGNHKIVQVSFYSGAVFFETAKNPHAPKLN